MNGAERISEERRRQQGAEGYTEDHDDAHDQGQLAMAAALYAAPCRLYEKHDRGGISITFRDPWPWDDEDDKRPRAQDPTVAERVRVLEKAGALIAAEIDRLLRVQAHVDAARKWHGSTTNKRGHQHVKTRVRRAVKRGAKVRAEKESRDE